MDIDIEIAMNMEIERDAETYTDIGRGTYDMRRDSFRLMGVSLGGNVAVLCPPQ